MEMKKRGRPKKDNKLVYKTIYLPPELWREIGRIGAGNFSKGLREALKNLLPPAQN